MPLHRHIRPRHPLLVALALLGVLGMSSGADAQQPVIQQQSSTVRQTNVASVTNTGDGSSSQTSTQVVQNSASTTQTNTTQGSTQRVSVSQTTVNTGTPPQGAGNQTTVVQSATSQSATSQSATSQSATAPQTTAPQASTSTAAAAPPAARPTESLQLLAGCSNVALSWAVGTPLAAVAAAVDPPHALASIFKQDAPRGGYRGYMPTAPSFATDYTAVEAPLEAVFLCVTQAATLTRPTG